MFASLTLKSELATKLLDTDKEAARNEMRAINELSRETLNKVRTIIDDLKVQSFEEEVLSVESILHDANLNFIFKNNQVRKDRRVRKELEKNKYINVLIAEQERNRIGQDLHDTLGHVFASLTLKSELATKLLDTDKEAARNEMRAINELSRDT